MKKIKYLFAAIAFSFLMAISGVNAQTTDSSNSSAMSSSTTTTTQTSNEGKNNPTALIIGVLGLVVLAAVVGMMYRNRKNAIGGMQSQNKNIPEPATPESINNPGAGV